MAGGLNGQRGGNADSMMLRNQIAILQYLQVSGICTRAQIAKHIGLTQAAISKITAGLIERGIIEETGFHSGEKGRRSIGIRICAKGCRVIGVKLSRRNYAVGVFDFSGQCQASTSEQFRREDKLGEIFHRIRKAVRGYIADYPDVAAVGMAVPGPFLRDEEVILMITEMGNASACDIDLRAEFSDLRMGGLPVILYQDANAGAMADWWFGIENIPVSGMIAHFLVGEGVGVGIVSDGRVLDGELGTAGELGHVSIDMNGAQCHCGNKGCLEMYCSSLAFVDHAMAHRCETPDSALNRYAQLSAATIFREARAGDAFAQSLVRRVGEYIGVGVVNIVNMYNPSTIIVANEMAQGGELLLSAVKHTAQSRLLSRLYQSVNIVLSTYEGDDILCGAAAVAIDYCLSRPYTLTKKSKELVLGGSNDG